MLEVRVCLKKNFVCHYFPHNISPLPLLLHQTRCFQQQRIFNQLSLTTTTPIPSSSSSATPNPTISLANPYIWIIWNLSLIVQKIIIFGIETKQEELQEHFETKRIRKQH